MRKKQIKYTLDIEVEADHLHNLLMLLILKKLKATSRVLFFF